MNKGVLMFKRLMGLTALLALFVTPAAYSQDWGLDTYDSYDPGFYDTATSDLYDVEDDWFYDSYTIGAQEEEEEDVLDNSYDWEADNELFDDEI
jgi:hypothetical protein